MTSSTTPTTWCAAGPRLVAFTMIQAILPEVAGQLRAGPEPDADALEVIAQGLDQVRLTLAADPPAARDLITELSRHAAAALAAALADGFRDGSGPDFFQMQEWLLIRRDAVSDRADRIATRTVSVLVTHLAGGQRDDIDPHAQSELETLIANAGDSFRLACAVAGLAAGLLMHATGDVERAKAAVHAHAAPLPGMPGGLVYRPSPN